MATASRSAGTRLRPAERRRQLVDAATALFLEQGYGKVSVSDIARAAGISGPSVYRHFPDKEAILAAAMRSAVDEMAETTARVLARPGATFEDLSSAVFAMAVSRPGPLALWRWNRRHLTAEQAREMIAASESVLGSWTEVLRRDHPELTDDDARVLTWAVLAVGGSVPPSRGRIGIRRYRADLELIARRVLRAAPSTAPQLPAPPPHRAPVVRSDEILDAASELFFSRGYSAVSMDDIGAAVGISGPSVYGHFPSKGSILVGIVARARAALEIGVVGAAGVSDGDPLAELRALVRSYAANLVSSTDLAVAFTVGREVVIESGGEALLAAQKAYVARWVALLAAGSDGGIDAAGARIAVGAAMTIANDFARTRRLRGRPRFHDELVHLVDAALGI
ncbi:TetR/AcrR family transcriptional regulator [Tsukamurella sp. M9C]|uniref:TetR/AcrR family transcriptional regulator n=1 Tax=Tsukamurella sp. M9C TaxID=2877520 RepID=UPI001CCD7B42|nr:TetR/AcrR family transcriptional regulator [Tsukamurella sp. M9C]MCA0158788.1 TetR/AcrR family transcriptional regulator [Tsukamurella sp. M9C]